MPAEPQRYSKSRIRSICNSFRKNLTLSCVPNSSAYNMLPFNITIFSYLIYFKSLFKYHSIKQIFLNNFIQTKTISPLFLKTMTLYLFHSALIFFEMPSILYLYVLICSVPPFKKKINLPNSLEFVWLTNL